MGISNIAKMREQDRNQTSFQESKEITLADGDIVVGSIVPSGEDDDTRLDEFLVHGIGPFSADSGKQYWKFVYCLRSGGEDKSCKMCADGDIAQRKFGLWLYVKDIYHASPNRREEDKWPLVELANGSIKKYRQSVNAFRTFAHGFGKGDYLWNQLVEIYNEYQGLNKMVVKIVRTGSRKETTSYAIVATREVSKLSKELLEEAKKLPSIKDFYMEEYKQSLKNKVVEVKNSSDGSSSVTVDSKKKTQKIKEEEDFSILKDLDTNSEADSSVDAIVEAEEETEDDELEKSIKELFERL